jgi:hypothetical protein
MTKRTEIPPSEVLDRLNKPEPEHPVSEQFKNLPPISLKRSMCERFLQQEMALGRLPYDFGRHCRGYWEHSRKPHGDWDTPDKRLFDLFLFSIVVAPHLTNEDVEAITRAYIAKEKLPDPILVHTFPDYRACTECGACYSLYTDGLKMWCPDTCPYPNGPPPYHYDFKFPSGKIVIENDLRHLFPDHEDFSGQGVVWEQRITAYYAKLGMAHFFVGNTCPGFWRVGKDSYVIAPTPRDNDYNDIEVPWKSLGGICTDLWWYSIMDHDLFFAKGGKKQKHHQDIVEVEPGTYRFTHMHHLTRDKGGVDEIYTKIEKIK